MAFNINDIDVGSSFFYINDGKDYEVSKEEAVLKIMEKKYVVKVEGLEHLYPGSNSVHMFISPAGSGSFKTHIDEVDLKILCTDGVKTFEVDGDINRIEEGEHVMVPAGTPHRATNPNSSVILSIEL